jgi:hypothetical protein
MALVYVGSWPGPGFHGRCRKLTLAGKAIAAEVSFLAPPPTHTGGQKRSVASCCFTAVMG